MSDERNCPKCGATLAADVPEEGCPRCLLAAGFESADGGAPAGDAPSIDELSKHFPDLEIEELLGRGGMGVVYRARQKRLDRLVALKILSHGLDSAPGGRAAFEERFTREARALARLSHANIVAVHEFGERDGMFFLLMEYVDGVNLREAMRAGDLDPSGALAIVPQICDALQYAHDQGVVHRDIKPENVLMDTSGVVKIADFGLAKLLEPTPADFTLTGAGQVMGTPHYMAPEQIESPSEVDHRADIYSLGVVFYEMLTGTLPIGRFDPPSHSLHVDVRLDEVVLRALEKDRDRRYQSASEVKTSVGAVGAAGSVAAAVDAAAEAVAPHAEARGWKHERHRDGHTFRREHEGRLSKMALAGFLTTPTVVVLVVVLAYVAGVFSSGQATWGVGLLELVLVGPIVLIGVVLSIVAWVRIERSKGTLHGKWLAILGVFMPMICCVPMTGASVLWMGARHAPEGPPFMYDSSGDPIPAPEVPPSLEGHGPDYSLPEGESGD